MGFSYPPSGEQFDKDYEVLTVEKKEERSTQNKGVSSGSPYVSSGSVSKMCREDYYEALPHFRKVNTLKKKNEAAAAEGNHLTVLVDLIKRHVSIVNHIVCYLPDAGAITQRLLKIGCTLSEVPE